MRMVHRHHVAIAIKKSLRLNPPRLVPVAVMMQCPQIKPYLIKEHKFIDINCQFNCSICKPESPRYSITN